ncbi:MAG TPA: lysophospholipid acyltransferase family protein [Beijerinckiaceae bacterium]|nr:1-acyl-sn-glycerol-3-phosphate acyltransferase [Methylobacteriaceae bacterium]HRY02625.1 lysophospholipid acyltransferase family protein [Beijerinckiaceae bacterium]
MAALRLISISILIAFALALGLALAPLSGRTAGIVKCWFRRRFCQLACKSLGIRIEYEGAIPRDYPVLLVANHISWTDVLALGSRSDIVFLARHDLATWPILGTLARSYGTLFVERGRRRLIPHVNRQMAASMEDLHVVALFPEATTGDGTRLRKFHSSHFAAARDLLAQRDDIELVHILPVVIAYTRRSGLPLGRAGRAAVAWYGDTDFAPHLRDLVNSGPAQCRVRFLTPIRFDRATDRKFAARQAALAIQDAFRGEIMESGHAHRTAYVHSGQLVV